MAQCRTSCRYRPRASFNIYSKLANLGSREPVTSVILLTVALDVGARVAEWFRNLRWDFPSRQPREFVQTQRNVRWAAVPWNLDSCRRESRRPSFFHFSAVLIFEPVLAIASASSEVGLDMVFCFCSPSASRFDVVVVLACISAHHGCKEALFELLWPSCKLEPACPFTSILSSTRCFRPQNCHLQDYFFFLFFSSLHRLV